MTIPEPVWCTFCSDRPAIGKMVIMRDRSREQIGDMKGDAGLACDLHGRAWTGTPVGENEETGELAVFQYVHPDFEQVTEEHIINFAAEGICSVCGDPTNPMPLWVSERILKARPDLVLEEDSRWEGICVECANQHNCPQCNDEEDEWHTHYD